MRQTFQVDEPAKKSDPMSSTAMAKTGSASREDLIFAIEQLTEQVWLLGNIIDNLTSELPRLEVVWPSALSSRGACAVNI